MRCGVRLPAFGDFGQPGALAELAREAEAAGWQDQWMPGVTDLIRD